MPVLCVCVVWGQLVCCSFGLRLLRLRQGVGVSRSTLPASLFEHPSMSQAFNPPTQTTQRCEVRALMPNVALSPPHVCHRRRTGLSSWARTCSKRWSFLLAPPHQGAPVLIRTVCASTEMQNTNCNNFMSGNHVRGARYNAYFRALAGDLSTPMHD